jgi:cell division protein FtsQ
LQSVAAEKNDSLIDDELVRAKASHHVVLPRFLRRPVRAMRRVKLPRHLGTKAVVALFVVTAVGGTIVGGHGMTVLSAVTAAAGFQIENVKITGQTETSEVDVLHALDIGTYPSTLTLDLEDAKARIETLPWVKRATLKKLFPSTVDITVVERQPYALWQHEGTLSLIDDAGKVITDDVDDRYAALPQVIGPGAAPQATAYTALLARFPTIAPDVRAGIFVSEDRWTLVLKNGIELMLPSDDPVKALQTIADLDRDHAVLSREIAAIDLREPGHLVVRLTEAGVVAHDAALKEREKLAKSRRTNT